MANNNDDNDDGDLTMIYKCGSFFSTLALTVMADGVKCIKQSILDNFDWLIEW